MGASVWASGSQVWTGQTGSFMAKAATKNQKTTLMGTTILVGSMPPSASFTMSKVPTPGVRNTARMATSMKALPKIVKIRNFMAEYSLRPVPQIEMSMYMGSSSSSQKRKKRRKSRDTKTPITAVWSTSSQMKYSFTLSLTFHEASTAAQAQQPRQHHHRRAKPVHPQMIAGGEGLVVEEGVFAYPVELVN